MSSARIPPWTAGATHHASLRSVAAKPVRRAGAVAMAIGPRSIGNEAGGCKEKGCQKTRAGRPFPAAPLARDPAVGSCGWGRKDYYGNTSALRFGRRLISVVAH